jgi:hypothetical protein
MKCRSNFGFYLVIVSLLVGSGVGVGRRWLRTQELRVELESLRMGAGELERWRAENARLRAAQISSEELERLRADHAALPRLRAEIEALRKRIDGGAR